MHDCMRGKKTPSQQVTKFISLIKLKTFVDDLDGDLMIFHPIFKGFASCFAVELFSGLLPITQSFVPSVDLVRVVQFYCQLNLESVDHVWQ